MTIFNFFPQRKLSQVFMLEKKGKKLIYSDLAEKLRFRNKSIYLSWGVKVSNIIAAHRKLIHFYLPNESPVEKKQRKIIHLLEPRYNKSYK